MTASPTSSERMIEPELLITKISIVFGNEILMNLIVQILEY